MRRVVDVAFAFAFVVMALACVGVLGASASTCTWTGTDSGNWSDPNNWNGNVTNCTSPSPVSGSTLTFPSGASTLATINDLPALNTYTIQISGSGYTLSGNAVELGGNLADSDPSGANTIALSLDLPQDTKVTTSVGEVLTISGPITSTGGAFNLEKSGTGALILLGNNTFTGGLNDQNGTVSVASDASLGAVPGSFSAAALDFTGGDLITTASFSINVNRGITISSATNFEPATGTTLTIPTVISSTTTGAVEISDAGTVVLSGANTFTGVLDLNAGTLSVSSDGNLGAVPGTAKAKDITFLGGQLDVTSSISMGSTRGITFTNNGVIDIAPGATFTVAGIITGAGNLDQIDSGTLVLTATNTLAGTVTLGGGTLKVLTDRNFGKLPTSVTPGSIVFAGGQLVTNGGSFTLNANRGIAVSTTTTWDIAPGTTVTYGGIATGSGGLTLIDTGTLILSGANTYGATTVNAGTVVVNGSLSGSVSLHGGALDGGGTVGTVTTTAAGSSVVPGTSGSPAILTTGNVNLSSGSPAFSVQITGTSPGVGGYSQLSTGGTINLTGATLSGTITMGNPTNGTVFTILNNTGASAIVGTFSGLAEGSNVTIGSSSFVISYVGGLGHSVTLTAATPVVGLAEGVSELTGVPGDNLLYTVTFTNSGLRGAVNPQIVVATPNNADFEVGSVSQSLGTTGLSVAVAYSNDGGATFTYTPVSGGGGAAAGYDRNVTTIQWTFTGTLSATVPNNTGSVSYTAAIQ